MQTEKSKLPARSRIKILEMYAAGQSCREISDVTGVSYAMVYRIVNAKNKSSSLVSNRMVIPVGRKLTGTVDARAEVARLEQLIANLRPTK